MLSRAASTTLCMKRVPGAVRHRSPRPRARSRRPLSPETNGTAEPQNHRTAKIHFPSHNRVPWCMPWYKVRTGPPFALQQRTGRIARVREADRAGEGAAAHAHAHTLNYITCCSLVP